MGNSTKRLHVLLFSCQWHWEAAGRESGALESVKRKGKLLESTIRCSVLSAKERGKSSSRREHCPAIHSRKVGIQPTQRRKVGGTRPIVTICDQLWAKLRRKSSKQWIVLRRICAEIKKWHPWALDPRNEGMLWRPTYVVAFDYLFICTMLLCNVHCNCCAAIVAAVLLYLYLLIFLLLWWEIVSNTAAAMYALMLFALGPKVLREGFKKSSLNGKRANVL